MFYLFPMNQARKIAFIGSHGVGKTTLCFELAAALKRLDLSVDLVKEVARGCPLPINRETTGDAQNWILHTQVAREIELSAAFDVIICDRAVLDNYAYMVHAEGRRPEIEPFIRHWMDTYGLLVKVPIVTPPAFDGTRDTSVDLRIRDFPGDPARRVPARLDRTGIAGDGLARGTSPAGPFPLNGGLGFPVFRTAGIRRNRIDRMNRPAGTYWRMVSDRRTSACPTSTFA